MRYGRFGLLVLLLLAAFPAWAQSLGSPGGGGFNLRRAHERYVGEAGGVCRPADAPVIGLDAVECNTYGIVLGGNRQFANPVGLLSGQEQGFEIGQPLSGGPFVASFGSAFIFSGGASPPSCSIAGQANCFSTANGAIDYLPCKASILLPGKVLCGSILQNLSTTATETWSTTQKNSNLSLSPGNLVATDVSSSGNNHAVYGLTGFSTGKFFWQVTSGFSVSGDTAVGIGNASSSTALGAFPGSSANDIGYVSSGTVFANNTNIASIAAYTSGTAICVAVDYGNAKVWFQPIGSGSWDNTTDSPAANTGGFSITSVTSTGTIPFLPAASTFNNGDVMTANFSGSACSGVAGLAGFAPL